MLERIDLFCSTGEHRGHRSRSADRMESIESTVGLSELDGAACRTLSDMACSKNLIHGEGII